MGRVEYEGATETVVGLMRSGRQFGYLGHLLNPSCLRGVCVRIEGKTFLGIAPSKLGG
jgi:hypothetical protein